MLIAKKIPTENFYKYQIFGYMIIFNRNKPKQFVFVRHFEAHEIMQKKQSLKLRSKERRRSQRERGGKFFPRILLLRVFLS